MTAPCGTGTPQPKPGTATAVDVGAAALGVILTEAGYPWIIPAVPLLNLAPFAPATFCASAPPSQPTFTLAESDALLNLTFGTDFTSALGKFATLCQNIVWYSLCECNNGTVLSVPAPTAPPSGTPIPFQAASPSGQICASYPPFNSGTPINYPGFHLGGCIANGIGALPFATCGLTATPSTVVWGFRYNHSGSNNIPHCQLQYGWCYGGDECQSAQYQPWAYFPVPTDGAWHYFTLPVPSLAYGHDSEFIVDSSTNDTVDVSFAVYCGGAAGNTSTCCPPDPIVVALLEQILTTLTAPAAPIALVSSTAHTALSGSGTISAIGLKGVQVTLTTIPSAIGESLSNPNVYFDAGWITPFTSEGPELGSRVRYSTQFIPFDAYAAGFDYYFPTGVVATITEVG